MDRSLAEPGPAIFGYTSRFSFEPGERVPIHVSCEQLERYAAQLVRLRHGYEGPAGPGFREEELASGADGVYAGAFHRPNTGSYVTVSDPAGLLAGLASWTVELHLQATTPQKSVQCLLGSFDAQRSVGYAVVLRGGRLGLLLGDGEHEPVSLMLEAEIEPRCWYRVRASRDAAAREAAIKWRPPS